MLTKEERALFMTGLAFHSKKMVEPVALHEIVACIFTNNLSKFICSINSYIMNNIETSMALEPVE